MTRTDCEKQQNSLSFDAVASEHQLANAVETMNEVPSKVKRSRFALVRIERRDGLFPGTGWNLFGLFALPSVF